jgi:hypothetical protein
MHTVRSWITSVSAMAMLPLCLSGVSFAVAGQDSSADLTAVVGKQSDGSFLVPTSQRITSAGTQITFAGRPTAVALSPDLTKAAFLNGRGIAPVVVVDLHEDKILQLFDPLHQAQGPAYFEASAASTDGIIYSHDGKKLFASTPRGILLIADVAGDGTLSLNSTVTLPKHTGDSKGPYPTGLALSADDKTLYVVLGRYNSLGVFDVASRQLLREIPVGVAPHAVVVSGNTAYVSNQGGRKATAGEFTVLSSGTPVIANRKNGSSITGTVSVVDLEGFTTTDSIEVGLQPTALLLLDDYLLVANTNSDTISFIDRKSKSVVKTADVRPFDKAPLGSAPNGLALAGRNGLAVSLGTSNAIALYKLADIGQPIELEGLIPTGWYPGAVAVDWRNRLVVTNVKGIGSIGPDVTVNQDVGPTDSLNEPFSATGKFVATFAGSASIIPEPSPEKLQEYTHQVFHNNNWSAEISAQANDDSERGSVGADDSSTTPVPTRPGERSPIKHVFYIIKENNTYDSILGDDPRGNGDPKLAYFGGEITPNHHALASQFNLLDNLYVVDVNSAVGHQWTDQAMAPDYLEKMLGGTVRSYPFNGGDSLAYLPSGFLWDNALRHHRSVRIYGEFAYQFSGPNASFGTWSDWYGDALILAGKRTGKLHVPVGTFQAHSDVPSVDQNLNRNYPPFNISIPDQYRAEIFLQDFRQLVASGGLPSLTVMILPSDHNNGFTPGYPGPGAMVADNDLALGRIVDAISHSRYWRDSAIFVIEDDAQNDVDHVDGHRTVGFVISPFARRGHVDHALYSQIDMVRTIEQILGLPPMHPLDLAAHPMNSLFQNEPDYTAYSFVPNQVPLDEVVPQASTLKGMAKKWALASAAMPKSNLPDAADPDFMRHVNWYAMKGFNSPLPGERRVLSPEQVRRNSLESPRLNTPDTD